MPRITRSLKTLQNSAADTENLIGRPSKNLKHQLSQETVVGVEVKRKNVTTKEVQVNNKDEVKRKNTATKEVQVNIKEKVTVDDLTNPEGASEKYWQILAEKRQHALQESLDENEKLRKIIDDLKEENSNIKQMLEEANSFVEVIKEELDNCSNNDTGIDVNDISTADETHEEIHDTKTE